MKDEIKVALAISSYKREWMAERLLDSIEKYCPFIKYAIVYYYPSQGDYTPKSRDWQVLWVKQQPEELPKVRNKAVKLAIEHFNPDIVWLTDDDVIVTEFTTPIKDVFPLVMRKDVGVVAITRQMKTKNMTWGDVRGIDIKTSMPYIGGGYLFTPDKFLKVGGFPEGESAGEMAFTLNFYIHGYENYRTARAYAIHEQGKGQGGLYQALRDDKPNALKSKLLESGLVEAKKDYTKYRGKNLESLADFKPSIKAKELHKRNKALLHLDNMQIELKIEMVNIDEIIPYWRNPRKNEAVIEPLMESIKKFGFNVPLVLDKNYVIITGHARYIASKRLGLKKIPCIIRRDLSEKEAREYRIADNKLSEIAEWDMEYLRKELMELEEVIGFSKQEIESILKEIEEKEITQEEINKVAEKMEHQFEELTKKYNAQLVKVTCPFCLKDFEIDKIKFLKEVERV